MPVTTFDRYLLRRFWHVFAIGFSATYGLYVVFDAFTNADEFHDRSGGGIPAMLGRMAMHYFYHSSLFLDLIGPTLAVISVMAVFAILQRQREVYPVLSAGVPTYRLAVPVLVGVVSVIVLMIINQEIVLPRIAHRLQAGRGTEKSMIQEVQTARDFVTNVEITGARLDLSERTIEEAEFLLPVPDIVAEPETLRAKRAIYFPRRGESPAGWVLRQATPAFSQLRLTERGETLILSKPDSQDLFVATDVTIDQLYNRGASFKFLSTAELVQRIRNPAFGALSIRGQTIHLHERLTRPFGVLFAALIAVPLTMKRESRGLLENMAVCCGVLGLLYLFAQVSLQLGRLNLYPMALGAWLPLVAAACCAVWYSYRVQT